MGFQPDDSQSRAKSWSGFPMGERRTRDRFRVPEGAGAASKVPAVFLGFGLHHSKRGGINH
jgi:hypothetical protein